MLFKRILLTLLLSLSSFLSYSGIIYVTDNDDTGPVTSLTEAANNLQKNDTIVINYKGGITLNATILLENDTNVTIIGPGPIHNSFFAEAFDNLFELKNCENVTFIGMGFKHAIYPFQVLNMRSFIIENSSVNFYDCTFEGNRFEGEGGAMFLHNDSRVNIYNCSFFDNSTAGGSGGAGGAIYFDNSDNTGRIENCTFYQNEAETAGGAVYIDSITTPDAFTFQNNTFYENLADTTAMFVGHAVDYRRGPFSLTNTYIYFFHNLFYENGGSTAPGNFQIYYPTYADFPLLMTFAENNYILKFSTGNDSIGTNFKNNPLYDFEGFNASNLHLRSNFVTDGYGLKYFTITDAASELVNSSPRLTGVTPRYTPGDLDKDCRRAPRVLLDTVDIGASEFTPYRVTSTNNLDWEATITSLNSAAQQDNYIEFDLPSYAPNTDRILVNTNVPIINFPVYIDGFSQEGTEIPGPNNVGLVTDEYYPATNLVTFNPLVPTSAINGFNIIAPNVTIAGLGISGFNGYGVHLDIGAKTFKLQGSHIGLEQTVSGFVTDVSIGNQLGGVNILSDSSTFGGFFHHERNTLSGNGFSSVTGANLKATNADVIDVFGNVIGLHPNGKDSLNVTYTNSPDGILFDNPTGATIGYDYIFGKNIISGNPGKGICHTNGGLNNTINFNHIGLNFLGDEARPNTIGVEVNNSSSEYHIGKYGRNVISGNRETGVLIDSSFNILTYGNIIGGNADLSDTIPNQIGVEMTGTGNKNIVGGNDYTDDAQRNIIVGNDIGIHIHGPQIGVALIRGNLIGVPTEDATTAMPNYIGIELSENTTGNIIGYEDTTLFVDQINIIAGNVNEGIYIHDADTKDNIVKSNVIGSTNPSGTPNALGNGIGVRVKNVTNGSNHIGNANDTLLHLLIHDHNIGVRIDSSDNQHVHNSFIGLDTNGVSLPNEVGVYLSPESESNEIGGSAAQMNIISANDSAGVFIDSTDNNAVIGNYIGVDKDGITSMGNRIGVAVRNGESNKIGTTNSGNVISGNDLGVFLTKNAKSNGVVDNHIGLSADGTSIVANSKVGVYVNNTDSTNFIGLNLTYANFFECDSIDILINESSNQEVQGNILGMNGDSTAYLGTAQNGVGIRLNQSTQNTIGGLGANEQNVIANKRVGILFSNADSNRVQHNYLGNNPEGNSVLAANNQRVAIGTRSNSNYNIIGPDNVIGGNEVGIYLAGPADTNTIYGNLIGIDTALTVALSNDTAIIISGSEYNRIGGETADSSNTMVNGVDGVVLRLSANNNTLINNNIGTPSFANSGVGLRINNSENNRLGGANLSERNTITNNGGNGITISGTGSAGNSLLRNSIFDNGGLGIDIGDDGATVNNASGIQDNIQIPIIQSGFPCTGTSDIQLSVILRDLTIGQEYYLDIYNITDATYQDGSGFGESGPLSIHYDTITAATTQDTIIVDLLPYGLNNTVDTMFTAMITSADNGSSSEYAANIELLEQPQAPTFTVTDETCKFAGNGQFLADNSANAAYDFDFSVDGTPHPPTGIDSLEVTGLTPGTYNVQLDYDNGCTENYNQVLNVGPTFTLSAVLSEDTCGLGNGEIVLTATPDQVAYFTAGFSYSIDNGTTFGALNDNVFSGLSAGDNTNSVATSVVNSVTCYSDTISNTIGSYSVPTAQLNFGYSDFCHDTVGFVTSQPIFPLGDYAISTAATGYTFNTSTGELTGAEPDSTYKIVYQYGSCPSTVNNVLAYFVPSDNFVYPDFCQNVTGLVPVPDSSGGIFSLLSQPVGNGNINSTTGGLFSVAVAQDLTAGVYEVMYNTNDVNCPRRDTVFVEVLTKAPSPTIINPVPSNDSVYFCRNEISLITSSYAQTNWFLGASGIVSNSVDYLLTDLPVSQDTSLFYYRDSVYISGDVCVSDTSQLIIHLHDIPAQPSIQNGDVEYCEGEVRLDLTNTDPVNWYETDLSSVDGTGTNFPTVFQNGIFKYYAQAESAEGCLSLLDSVELTGYLKPPVPNIIEPVLSNDTAYFCRNTIDTLKSDFYQTVWDLTAGGSSVTDFNYLLTNLPINQDTTVYYRRDSIYSITKTCASDTDSVLVHLYNIPAQPAIQNGDIEYCEGETRLDLINTDPVNWYETDLSSVDGTGTNFPTVFQDGIFKYYAQAESVEGCLSLLDSVELTGYLKPPVPLIIDPLTDIVNDTAYFCRNVIDTIKSDFYQTIWDFTPGGSSVTDYNYLLTNLPVGPDTTVYYRRDSIYSITKTCSSDTDSIMIHLYSIPAQPSIQNGDVEYCEGEIPVDLTNTDPVNWYETDLSSVDGTGTNFPTTFQNGVFKYYAQAESAEGCLSLLDSTELTGYLKPPVPVIISPVLSNDTAYFCRNTIDTLKSDFYQTIWDLTSGGSSVVDFNYLLTNLPVDQDTTVYFRRDSVYSLTKTCSSDTDSILVHLYDVPAQPSIQNGGVEYCEAETRVDLANTDAVNWYETDLSSVDGTGTNFPTVFQNGTIKYYAQAESVEGCLSLLDSTELIGYLKPPIPTIISPVLSNDTAYFCRNTIDTLKSDFYQTIWDLTSGGSSVINFNYLLTNIPVGQDTTVYFRRDSVYSVSKTCSSDTDSVLVHLYDVPAQPSIQNGDIEYCEAEARVDLTNIDPVNWYEADLNSIDGTGTNFPTVFQNGIVKYYAQAESAEGCLSLLDSTLLTGYLKPPVPTIISPTLSNDTAYFCRNTIDTLKSDFYQTIWDLTPGGSSVTNFNYLLTILPAGQDTTVYFRRDSMYSVTKTCSSDTDSVLVHLYNVPVKPEIINGDVAYCEDDIIIDLTTTTSVIVDWYVNDTLMISNTATAFTPAYNYTLGDSIITYYAREVSAEGCKSLFDTSQVTFHPKPNTPQLTINNTLLTFCPEDDLDTLFSDIESHWYLNSNTTGLGVNDTLKIPETVFTPGVTDDIRFYHVDGNNCHSDTGSIAVQVFDNPVVPDLSSIDTTYCEGDLTYELLEASNITQGSGYWYSDQSNQVGTGFTYQVLNQIALGDTVFYFDYDDLNGCRSAMDSITLYMYAIPDVAVISTIDSVYCEDEAFNVMTTETNVTTSWYQGHPDLNNLLVENVTSYTPDQGPGQYYIFTQTTINECSSPVDSIELVIHAQPAKPNVLGTKFQFCDYDDDGELFVGSGEAGVWYEHNDLTTPIFTGVEFTISVDNITDSAVYYIQMVEPLNNCASEFDTVTVYVHSTDSLTAGEDVSVCKGYEVELNASGGKTYAWSGIVIGQDQPNPMVSPLVETQYLVGITGHNGCFITDSVKVFIEEQGNCKETIYTAFSPNGDGVNENWIIEGIEGFENNVVYIYNRWGDLVAQINNYDNVDNVWDGINQSTGQPVVHGTYYFLLEWEGKRLNDGWVQVVK